jgi:hypothetical protein|tara:strand:- start:1662 stop:2081 length:420 start_codon:yes stop_codon:yes gene_type:complete
MLQETVQNVVDVINAGTYSDTFTAEVAWVPHTDNKDDDLKVFVWCDDANYNRETRCPDLKFSGTIKVAMRDRVNVDVQSDVTNKISLMQEIINQIGTVKTFAGGATFDSISWFTVYDNQALFEDSLFVSIFGMDIRSIV